MPSTTHDRRAGPVIGKEFHLTSDCQRVQAEMLDLAGALTAAALEEYGEALRPTLLTAVREFRRRFVRHVREIEGTAGLYDSIIEADPRLGSRVTCLCTEHTEMEQCLVELERRLAEFDPKDKGAIVGIRRWATRLADWIARHQCSARRLAEDAARS
jgi:hypothetical protein